MNNISRTFPPPPLRPQRFPVPGVSRGIKGGRTFGPDGGGWRMDGGFDADGGGDGDGVPDDGGWMVVMQSKYFIAATLSKVCLNFSLSIKLPQLSFSFR